MKKYFIPVVISFILFVCGFSLFKSQRTTLTDSSDTQYLRTFPGTPKDSDKAQDCQKLSEHLSTSYQSMLQLSKTASSKKGLKATRKVSKQYENRIIELQETDFNSLPGDELTNLLSEMSDISVAIFNAKNLLNS